MKGHSKIELKDIQTGDVQVFENDNLVTNALSEYLKCTGISDTTLFNATTVKNPLWQKLLGGILLFDTALEESVDNIFLPAPPVKMIGNGTAFYSTSGVVTELGNWNEQESGIQEDGSLKLVWDYGTNQANGTIACACLTSADAGYIGCGNAASKERYAAVATNGNTIQDYFAANTFKQIKVPFQYIYVIYADYVNNCIYYVDADSMKYNAATAEKHWYTTGTILIHKYRFGLSGIDVHISEKVENPVETYEITLPDTIKNWIGSDYASYSFEITVDENYETYIVFNKNASGELAANGDFYIMKINSLTEGTTTVYHMTNTAGYAVYVCYTIVKVSNIFGGYYYTKRTGNNVNYITRFKLNDSTDIDEIGYATLGANIPHQYIIGRNLYCSTGAALYRVNTVSKELEVQNGVYGHSSDIEKIALKSAPLLYLMSGTPSYQNHITYIERNHMYLATINNLSEPVVKTASKTMKVTYTVTFD